MLRAFLLAIGAVTAASSCLYTQEPSQREFRAITVESDAICRAWFIPTDEALAKNRLKSKQIPVSYIEELDLIHLTGRMTQLEYLHVFETNLTAKQIEGLATQLPAANIATKTPSGLAASCDGYLHLGLSK